MVVSDNILTRHFESDARTTDKARRNSKELRRAFGGEGEI